MTTHHVLLVEPSPDLRDALRGLMQDAGWIVDCATTTYDTLLAIGQTKYDCVFLNLDQGTLLNFGLKLADYAAARGARIIMIPDQEIDPATIVAKGWLQLTKPFTVAGLQAVMAKALGPSDEANEVPESG